MKLPHILSSLPVLTIALVCTTVSSAAIADQKHRNRNSSFSSNFNSGFSSNFNSGFNSGSHKNSVNRYGYNNRNGSSFRSSNTSRFRNTYSRRNNNVGVYFPQHRPSPYQNRPYQNRNNWSVSLNLGSGYYGSNRAWVGSGINYPVSRFGGTHYLPAINQTRVIYNQPTVVYVNKNSANTGHLSGGSARLRNETSLLRDINGFCFERSYDSRGIETRIQLPDSACNF